jgi:Rne/Rng family ribonuclease
MSKELVITSTPHETRVAILEDGQLCEIYVEREKEFALVGSIYKGRVTRVLPGMQSAFVDIGLDSDAFLYVSDFLENLEEYDQLVTTVEEKVQKMEAQGGQVFAPATTQGSGAEPSEAPAPSATESVAPAGSETPATENIPQAAPPPQAPPPQQFNSQRQGRPQGGFDRGGYGRGRDRGDRGGRHGGRGGRGGRGRDRRPQYGHGRELPPSKFASHRPYEPPPPPPGEEPILLPGESLAKYRERPAAAPAAPVEAAPASVEGTITGQPQDFSAIEASAAVEVQQAPAETEIETQVATQYVSEPEPEQSAPMAPESSVVEHAEPPAPPMEEPAQEHHAAADEHPAHDELTPEEATNLAKHLAEAQREEVEAAEQAALEASESVEEEFTASVEEMEEAGENGESASEEESEHAEFESEPAGEEETPAADVTAQPQGESQPVSARVNPGSGGRPRFQRPMRRGRQRGGRPDRQRPRHQAPRRPPQLISEVLKAGQEIIAQIAKEPLGKKGARITSHVALPGRYLVYMPTVEHIGVSRKISSPENRGRLRRLVMEAKGTFPGGFIVRTAAENATDDEIRTDIQYLGRTWSEILQRAEQRKAPSLLHRDLNLVERILRDHVGHDYSAVWVDNEEEFTKVVDFVNRFQPAMVNRVKLYTKPAPIFEEFGIQQEIDKALRPKVWLKSGGYIVINHTEALVAIDINTGKFVGKGSTRLEDTIVKTNLEAVKEIVRQIRLRDLGGIIVIDFIDMEERKNRNKVMMALEDALRADKAPSKVLSFNEFGLVAITRKRTKQALERTLCQPCPACSGSGMVKSIPTLCYEIQAEARKMAHELDGQSLTLRVNPEIAKALKTRESSLVEELETWTHKSVIIQSDPTLHWEQYDIY